MEPEISRRCPACGAAVRLRSTFCPNCGRPTSSVTAVDTSAVAETPATQENGSVNGVDLPDTASPPPPLAAVADAPDSESIDKSARLADDKTDKGRARIVTFVEQGAPGGARTKRQRVRTAAREAVEENLLPRVEKLRQASNVVLDEAAYDPSLRFILIALALFIIFLLLLLASKVLE